jgi:hypothetical protein
MHSWHRWNGPAIERVDGSKEWWELGRLKAVEDSSNNWNIDRKSVG